MKMKMKIFRLKCFRSIRRFKFDLNHFWKWFFFLTLIYLLNICFGVQYYLWSERSFELEYHLTMTRIDLNQIDENHPEKSLGPSKYFLSNRFLISNEHLCQINDGQPFVRLLILVKSAIEHVDAREAIRRTWAKKNRLEENSIRLAFVLGQQETNRKLNISIENESNQNKDLIQIDQVDSYYHNSYKMVMMLRWISNYCHDKTTDKDLYRYVLFIDDDYYLDVQHLIDYLNKIDFDENLSKRSRRTLLTGYVYKESRPRRFLHDRWFISIADYPYDRYPPYVTAGCFLMTRSNANLFYLASNYIRLFRFDDVYIGLLAYSMSIDILENNHLFSSYSSSSSSNILRKHHQNKRNFIENLSQWWNSFRLTTKTSIEPFCLHGFRGNDLIELWNDIYQTNISFLH